MNKMGEEGKVINLEQQVRDLPLTDKQRKQQEQEVKDYFRKQEAERLRQLNERKKHLKNENEYLQLEVTNMKLWMEEEQVRKDFVEFQKRREERIKKLQEEAKKKESKIITNGNKDTSKG